MTKTEAGELGCKLLGIYAFLVSLVTIQYPLSYLQPGLQSYFSRTAVLTSFIPTALLFICAAVLWFGSGRFIFAAGDDSSATASNVTPGTLRDIAFTVVGVFIIIDSIPQLGNFILQLNAPTLRNPLALSSLISFLIRLALGFWLIAGAAGLRKLLDRIGPAFRKDW